MTDTTLYDKLREKISQMTRDECMDIVRKAHATRRYEYIMSHDAEKDKRCLVFELIAAHPLLAEIRNAEDAYYKARDFETRHNTHVLGIKAQNRAADLLVDDAEFLEIWREAVAGRIAEAEEEIAACRAMLEAE